MSSGYLAVHLASQIVVLHQVVLAEVIFQLSNKLVIARR